MKTLTKKLKNVIKTGALLTSLAFAGGCAELGPLATLGQLSPYTTPDEKAFWGAVGTASQMEHEKEVAREGRSQVNVNIGEGVYDSLNKDCSKKLGFYVSNGNTLWKKCRDGMWRTSVEGQIFTASDKEVEEFSRVGGKPIYYGENEKREIRNYKSQFHTFEKYVDINGDGKVDSNEFFGLDKKVFEADKDINFVYSPFNNEKKISFSLWNSQGEKRLERDAYLNGNNDLVYFDVFRTNILGDYKIVAVPDRGDTQIIDLTVERSQQLDFFAFNYWKDLNRDGHPQPSEIIGYNKKIFGINERFGFWMNSKPEYKGKRFYAEILNPSGEVIYKSEDNNVIHVSYLYPSEDGFPEYYFKDKGGKGIYKTNYYIDGQFKESLQFEITE